MNSECFKIFVVDDDPVAQMITVDQLSGPGYEVVSHESGEACLAALDENPDLILMDVEMPGMSGIEACRKLRDAGNAQAQVIFVSARDDLETHLAAYDAGGNDFIVKPFAPEELAQKVRVAQQYLAQQRSISEQANYAQQAAFAAMSTMGEMGTAVQFLRNSFSCETPQQLAQALFDALGQYGLQGIIETRNGKVSECGSSHGICTPLEQSILGHARGMDRIFQFSDRLAINYPRITLLIPNLPADDQDRVGRLRDHLAIIVEGADSRLQSMFGEQRRLRQAEGVVRAAESLTQALGQIERQQSENRLRTLQVGNDYLAGLERAYVRLELTGSQEEALSILASEAIERYNLLQGEGKALSDQLHKVAGELHAAVSGNQGE